MSLATGVRLTVDFDMAKISPKPERPPVRDFNDAFYTANGMSVTRASRSVHSAMMQ